MAVEFKRIACLSLSKNEEHFYPSKLFKGDGVRLFLLNNHSVDGIVTGINSEGIWILIRNTAKDEIFISLSDIRSFNVLTRGLMSQSYFGR